VSVRAPRNKPMLELQIRRSFRVLRTAFSCPPRYDCNVVILRYDLGIVDICKELTRQNYLDQKCYDCPYELEDLPEITEVVYNELVRHQSGTGPTAGDKHGEEPKTQPDS